MYPASTALSFLFRAETGRVMENVVLMNEKFTFFSRQQGKEVDFIRVEPTVLPLEVKYTNNIKWKEIKSLFSFMEKNEVKEGIVITEDYQDTQEVAGRTITYIPLWRWLLSS